MDLGCFAFKAIGLSHGLQERCLMPCTVAASVTGDGSQEEVHWSPYFHINASLNLHSASSILKMKKSYLVACGSDTIGYSKVKMYLFCKCSIIKG